MIRFGPSGNDDLFYAEGHKSSVEAPKWLAEKGLSAYEISFGRGVRMTDKTAKIIGDKAREFGIQVSLHAPYFINLASPNPEQIEKSYGYIRRCVALGGVMGSNRVILHVGSETAQARDVALKNAKKNLKIVYEKLDEEGLTDFLLCIETMGKFKAIGNVAEICELCSVDPRVIPTLDFGHINCLLQGGLNDPNEVKKIFDICAEKLGVEKLEKVHIHFSIIEFTPAGEKKHLTLTDGRETPFWFDFEPIAREIKARKLSPTIICESHANMATDAIELKSIYEKA
jgi:deoxyribonuclease-4